MKRVFLGAALTATLLFYCASAMAYDSAPIGWASMDGGTTGGAGGTVVEVNNATDFIYYVQDTEQTPYIIYVSGTINLGGSNIRVRGNKTIIGRPGSHITGNLKSYRAEEGNNIYRFLNISNKDETGDGDCISIDGASHIWIDHCTFTDGGDGNVDIKNGADYVTVSWCIFEYTFNSGHNYSNLIGHADDNGDTDRGHLLVTFHHNWYSTMCKERMPRVRFGQVHVYNNYYSDLLAGGYCIGVGVEANIRVENNYFNAVPMPWKDYYTGNGAAGHIGWNTGNIFYNCTIPTWAANEYSTIFTPPYTCTIDDTNNIPALVQYGAGADGNDGYPPHWYFGYYGDFDRSGFVDMFDFAQFAQYWPPVSDCNQLWDADYNGDCEVDLFELSMLTEYWLYIAPDITPPAVPTGFWVLAGNATASLDWADNNEEDLAGYNIYRSTTYGGSYTKLNTSLLSNSNYTDNTVTNGTMYYYVVTSVDTSSNESAHSSEISAMPSSSETSIIIQEKNYGFCSVDGVTETKNTGYTGVSGYCNTDNANAKGINWRISIPSDGTYTLRWRYASLSGGRTAKLNINGSEVEILNISMPSTGAWTSWSLYSENVSLTAGIKTIRLEATTSNGLDNIDYLQVVGTNPAAASCP